MVYRYAALFKTSQPVELPCEQKETVCVDFLLQPSLVEFRKQSPRGPASEELEDGTEHSAKMSQMSAECGNIR